MQEDTDTFSIGACTAIEHILRLIRSQRQLIEAKLHAKGEAVNTTVWVNDTGRVRQSPGQGRLASIEAQSSLYWLEGTVGRQGWIPWDLFVVHR